MAELGRKGPANGLLITTGQAASGTHSAVAAHAAGTASTGWAETYFGDYLNQALQETDLYAEFDQYWDRSAQVLTAEGLGTKLCILIANEDWTNIYAQPLGYSPYYLTVGADPNFQLHVELHRKTTVPDAGRIFLKT